MLMTENYAIREGNIHRCNLQLHMGYVLTYQPNFTISDDIEMILSNIMSIFEEINSKNLEKKDILIGNGERIRILNSKYVVY